MAVSIDGANHCCGTCVHAAWSSPTEGECHATWWTYEDRTYRMPFTRRTVRTIRPFLLNRGCGTECKLWTPLAAVIDGKADK